MALTAMMRQYLTIKEQHKDALLFYRLGDFYEMFFEDAKTASRELGLTLTGRAGGLEERIPMCGVPYHSVDSYLAKLIAKGYHIAICEQMGDPADAKGMMDRAVVRVVTPGTVIESSILNDRANNYIMCVYLSGNEAGVCYADISTGEMMAEALHNARYTFFEEYARLSPAELMGNSEMHALAEAHGIRCAPHEDGAFEYRQALQSLQKQVKHGMDALRGQPLMAGAAGALLQYITKTQMRALKHLNTIKLYDRHDHLLVDPVAMSNLELTHTMRDGGRAGSLLGVLDKTVTSMGGRLMRSWIEQPYRDIEVIYKRQGAIGALVQDQRLLNALRERFARVADMERMTSSLAYGTFNARNCLLLRESLLNAEAIKHMLGAADNDYLHEICGRLDGLTDVASLINDAIKDNPSASVKEGGMIKRGFDEELDEALDADEHGKQWISDLETHEREVTGIKNLKVAFNQVFGYYIEITRSNLDSVPLRYQRKQTLANCERFTTAELTEMEKTILGARDNAMRIEYIIFTGIREHIYKQLGRIQATASALKELDVLCSLALAAFENNYTCPQVHNGYDLSITDGRHPVVERFIDTGFVPNDTTITEDERLMLITGPNMAGKSTYMRQVALITLMAHIGSYVPAARARIPLTDRIFTRVGASDDLASGQSTFMVEMTELASILKNATKRSLLIIDEIGRGTSTFDGLSIAWAAVEHICGADTLGAKALFATHYHELTELEGVLPGVVNYYILVKEQGDEILFLRKILRGGVNKSFGVQVASMAGLPQPLIARAHEIMARLEVAELTKGAIGQSILSSPGPAQTGQMSLDSYASVELCEEIKRIDVNAMTPMDALNMLYTLREKARLI